MLHCHQLLLDLLFGGGRGEGGEERNIPLATVGSRAGGDNSKRACSAQRRVGPKARLTASAPAPEGELFLVRALPYG